MKGHAYNILVEFQRTSSPFLFAHLILELGTQLIDRMTPELDDEATERLLLETIKAVRVTHDARRKRLSELGLRQR